VTRAGRVCPAHTLRKATMLTIILIILVILLLTGGIGFSRRGRGRV
jgi:hypothetical protein